jgi:hypothetical protein
MSQTGALSGAFDGRLSFLIKGGATLMRICACGKGAAQIRISDNSRITTLMCLNSRAVGRYGSFLSKFLIYAIPAIPVEY